MKKLKTITEHRLLTLALNSLLDSYWKEKANADAGSEIAARLCAAYNEQIKELEGLLLTIEQKRIKTLRNQR